MAKSPWQQRIRRAEHLAGKHPFAAEILGFYIQTSLFQEDLYQRAKDSGEEISISGSTALAPKLLAPFPRFLGLVQERGPELLAGVSRELGAAPASAWSDLLNANWSATDESPTRPEDFLALAFLQPLAELARSRAGLQLDGYTQPRCPFCRRKPVLAILRPQGDGGQRSLFCGFCFTEWDFRRVVCPGCGQEDHAKLPVYTAESFPYIRVECCDTCQTYIKSMDLTKHGLAEPPVDELASVPLNLWAQERGYAKLQPNLLGM